MELFPRIFRILNSIWIQIKITIQHPRNVNIIYQLPILDDGYLLNDRLVLVINQPLKRLYLSLHVIRGQFMLM
jgi:hypothetical protein